MSCIEQIAEAMKRLDAANAHSLECSMALQHAHERLRESRAREDDLEKRVAQLEGELQFAQLSLDAAIEQLDDARVQLERVSGKSLSADAMVIRLVDHVRRYCPNCAGSPSEQCEMHTGRPANWMSL